MTSFIYSPLWLNDKEFFSSSETETGCYGGGGIFRYLSGNVFQKSISIIAKNYNNKEEDETMSLQLLDGNRRRWVEEKLIPIYIYIFNIHCCISYFFGIK